MKFLSKYKFSMIFLAAIFCCGCTSVSMEDFEGHWFSKTTQRRELHVSNGSYKFFSGTNTVEGEAKLIGNVLHIIDPKPDRNDGGTAVIQEDGTLLIRDKKDWQLTLHKKE